MVTADVVLSGTTAYTVGAVISGHPQ